MISLVALLLAASLGREETVLDRARRAYEQQRFLEARTAFAEALEEKLGDEHALCFDLGLCELRLDRPADAVWSFERALARRPGDPRTLELLGTARERLGLAAEEVVPPWRAVLDRVDRLGLDGLLLLSSLATAAALLVLVAVRRRAGLRSLRLLGVLLLVLGLAGTLRWAVLRSAGPVRIGVVLTLRTPVRPEPHPAREALGELRAGERVRVRESSDRWIHVEHERVRGWTERRNIGVVDGG